MMEPRIKPAHEVRRRRAFRLCVAAALALALVFTEQTAAVAQNDADDLPLGRIRPDPIVIGGQIDLGVGYLTSALSILQSSESPNDLEAASTMAKDAYRIMRAAGWGIVGLGQKHRTKNPIHEIVSETLLRSRLLIVDARLRLEGVVKWPESTESQGWRMEAISKLNDALQLAQQARMMI